MSSEVMVVSDDHDRTRRRQVAGMIVRLFKESVLVQSRQAALALQDEFDQWERLSDEALVDFEKGLP